MKKNILAVALMATAAIQAFGWGQKGHDTVAFIAENHLTPTAKAALDSLLDGRSIVYWANWLDNASHTPEYAYTKTWHYKNVDEGVKYEKAPLNDKGDVVRAIYEQFDILSNPEASQADRTLATKILVHVVGDVHQPMHLGHLSDLGGNRVNVKYFNGNRNLHGIWDSALVESAHKWSYTEWQQQLDRLSKEQEAQILRDGNPDTWAQESLATAALIYQTTPEGYNVSYDYISDWTPTIEMQLLKGGLRLADVLNSALDPEYVTTNAFPKK